MKANSELCVMVSVLNNDLPKYGTCTVRFVTYENSGYRSPNEFEYDGLKLSCSWSADRGPYFFVAEYDVYYRTIGLRQAEAMAKTLKKIEVHLVKLDKKWGGYHTFPEYVARVADALGVKSGCYEGSVSGTSAYTVPIGEFVNSLDYRIGEAMRLLNEQNEKKEEVEQAA